MRSFKYFWLKLIFSGDATPTPATRRRSCRMCGTGCRSCPPCGTRQSGTSPSPRRCWRRPRPSCRSSPPRSPSRSGAPTSRTGRATSGGSLVLKILQTQILRVSVPGAAATIRHHQTIISTPILFFHSFIPLLTQTQKSLVFIIILSLHDDWWYWFFINRVILCHWICICYYLKSSLYLSINVINKSPENLS